MRPADLPIILVGALFLFEPFFVVSLSFLRAHLIRRNGDHTKKIYTFYDAESTDSRGAREKRILPCVTTIAHRCTQCELRNGRTLENVSKHSRVRIFGVSSSFLAAIGQRKITSSS